MTMSQNSLSSGPKTEAGKAVSSKNARKDAIFVQDYLPHEDIAVKQEQFSQLQGQWKVIDPSRLFLLRSIEQAQLGIERIMYIEQKKIAGLIQSLTIAKEFCLHAMLSEVKPEKLPAWFFLASGAKDKQHALQYALIYDEALELKNQYSDQLAALVKERYQCIVDGLRAEQMELAIDFEKSTRYATNFQNRMIKGYSGLAALDQHEALMRKTLQATPAELITLSRSEEKVASSE